MITEMISEIISEFISEIISEVISEIISEVHFLGVPVDLFNGRPDTLFRLAIII